MKVLYFRFYLKLLFLFLNLSFLFLKDIQAISWSGTYNAGGYYIENSGLVKENSKTKSYLTHHLSLSPKIILSDGLRLYSRFDFLNSEGSDYLGSVVANQNQKTSESSSLFKISSIYLNMVHEFGALIIGRVPMHFGLGMTYHSGDDFFNHWISTKNIIGYKIKKGRWLLFPMVSKSIEKSLDEKDDMNSLLFRGEYKNEVSHLTLGVLYEYEINQIKNVNPDLNLENHAVSKLNVYSSKGDSEHNFEVEAAFRWGKSGHQQKTARFSLFGLALEYQWKPKKYPRWNFEFWGGAAESVKANETRVESYFFNRNYDVAFLLFNHPMGESNPLNPNTLNDNDQDQDQDLNYEINRVDDEFLTNAIYLSPRFSYKITEKWLIETVLTQAWLWKNWAQKNEGKALGFELDVNFKYQYRKNVMWKTDLGVLFPGKGFKPSNQRVVLDGAKEKDLKFSYGLSTKISILF